MAERERWSSLVSSSAAGGAMEVVLAFCSHAVHNQRAGGKRLQQVAGKGTQLAAEAGKGKRAEAGTRPRS